MAAATGAARGRARAPAAALPPALVLLLLLLLPPLILAPAAHAEDEIIPDQRSFEEAEPELIREALMNVSRQLGGQSTASENVTSHIIDSVDALTLPNGDGDIDLTDTRCASEVESFCPGVIPGFNRIAMCLWDEYQTRGYPSRNRVAAQQGRFSSACIEYVVELQTKLNENINGDVQVAWACKGDVESLCRLRDGEDGGADAAGREQDGGEGHGDVLSCLEDEYSNLQSDRCRVLVREKIRMSNKDWRLDPGLNQSCRGDMDTLCKRTDEDEHGARYACLLKYLNQASPGCQRQVFRHKVITLGQGDYRLAQKVRNEGCGRAQERIKLLLRGAVAPAPGTDGNARFRANRPSFKRAAPRTSRSTAGTRPRATAASSTAWSTTWTRLDSRGSAKRRSGT